jgi:D-lactate dehydrogenase (cytochrome)
MTASIRTRPPRGTPTSVTVEREAAAYLEDAAHYPGGHAAGVAFPRSEADVAAIVRSATGPILPIGAQSSLTGSGTPFGEVVLSTAHMRQVGAVDRQHIIVQAGVTLVEMEEALRAYGATYPPVPTFTGAFAGGVAATNAAGAATFKYGCTRDWIRALTVVLANGEVLDLIRGECVDEGSGFTIHSAERAIALAVPAYDMPKTAKVSAGYFARRGMDLIDLFIGSEGTLGVVTEVTFRALHPRPAVALALVACTSERQGLELAGALRDAAIHTWRTGDPDGIDIAAIEHMDRRSMALARSGGEIPAAAVRVPENAALALLIQLELPEGTDAAAVHEQVAAALEPSTPGRAVVRFCRLLARFGLLDATEIAAPGDERRMRELLAFREAVPAAVNARVAAAKSADPRIGKTAADMIVPFERFGEMMEAYRRGFESRGLDYAIWGHVSDGNVHPNVIPRSYDDVVRGSEAILEFGREVARLGGCPLAEHGVGRNPIKQALLRQLYGESGLEEMRAVKRALDPGGKLAPGVIF